MPVEQPAEATVGVEARQAAPVDGAAAGDEGGGMTVADEAVIGNRRVIRPGDLRRNPLPRRSSDVGSGSSDGTLLGRAFRNLL